MQREAVLQTLSAYKQEFSAKYGVTRLGIFGSVARGEAGGVSDVDIVVEMPNGTFETVTLRAEILRCDSPVTLESPECVAGKSVVVIEDGPTLTHGSMSFGAGVVGARAAGVADIVDPVPYAVSSIAATFAKYPNAAGVLPAMGYGESQIHDLEATIVTMPVQAIVSGTPIDISRVLTVDKPLVRARYELREQQPGRLEAALRAVVGA